MSERLTKKEKGFVQEDIDSLYKRAYLNAQIEMWENSLIENDRPKKIEDTYRYIYVVKCDNYYKIGIAMNIMHRLSSMKTGNPYDITLVLKYRHPKADLIEKKLHSMYRNKNHKNEWFVLDNNDLEYIKKFIKSYE